MAVYRFRVTFEDQDDVYREIEIRANQTFEDLHHVILQSIGFDTQHNASFYMSDDYWRKGQEITLNPPPQEDDDDLPRLKKKATPPRVMKQSKLAAFIEDPHQKIVYIYDPKANWVLNLELIKIVLEDAKINYPKCIKSVGPAPKQYKVVTPPPVAALEDDEEGASIADEPIFATEEAYDESGEEDDALTSEEGEEQESEEEAEGEESEDLFGGGAEFGEDHEER